MGWEEAPREGFLPGFTLGAQVPAGKESDMGSLWGCRGQVGE